MFHVLTLANSKLKLHQVCGSMFFSFNRGTESLSDLALGEDLHVVKKLKMGNTYSRDSR